MTGRGGFGASEPHFNNHQGARESIVVFFGFTAVLLSNMHMRIRTGATPPATLAQVCYRLLFSYL